VPKAKKPKQNTKNNQNSNAKDTKPKQANKGPKKK